MKLLWRLGKEAIRYKALYLIAIISTLILTIINLTAPKLLSSMTGLVEKGKTPEFTKQILILTAALLSLPC